MRLIFLKLLLETLLEFFSFFLNASSVWFHCYFNLVSSSLHRFIPTRAFCQLINMNNTACYPLQALAQPLSQGTPVLPPFVQLICPHHSGDTSAVSLHGHPLACEILELEVGIRKQESLCKYCPAIYYFPRFESRSSKICCEYSRPDTLPHPHPSPASGSTLLGTPGALRNFLMVCLSSARYCKEDAAGTVIPIS